MRIGRFRFEPSFVPSLVTLALLPGLVGLGLWQLERAGEKEAAKASFAARSDEVPVYLNPRVERLASEGVDWAWWRYRRVEIAGRFDADHQYLLDNRTQDGVAGYHVLTPLVLPDSRAVVIVDRGWLPVGERREDLPRVPAGSGLTTLRARADRPLTPLTLGSIGYDAAGWPRVVQTVDVDRIARDLRRPVPALVLLLEPDHPDGFSRRWSPHLGIGPDRHRGYAFQWFSLAVALGVIYVVVNTRQEARG